MPVLAAVALAAGGVAYATIPDAEGTIHGCYGKTNGNLRVVESASDCRSNETAIDWNQQGPPGPPGEAGASKVIADEKSSEVSTTSDSYVDLGGPAVTVDVPPSGLIEFFARTELKGNPGCQDVALFEDGNFEAFAIRSCANNAYVRKWVAPSEGGGSGIFNQEAATWNVLEAAPGTHTYSLRYRTDTTQPDTAFFQNRKLWIGSVSTP